MLKHNFAKGQQILIVYYLRSSVPVLNLLYLTVRQAPIIVLVLSMFDFRQNLAVRASWLLGQKHVPVRRRLEDRLHLLHVEVRQALTSPKGRPSETFCLTAGQAGADGQYTPADAGSIDADNPANIFYGADVRVAYSKDIFSGADTITNIGVCTSVNEFGSAQVSDNDPTEVDTSPMLGIVTYSYDSAFQGQSPTAITPENIVQYQTDSYTSLIKLTCNISDATTRLWNMDYHVGMYRTLSQHIGSNAQLVYIVSPENSLEFFPLDGSNYIAHAEITEDGQGVLIEYAQTVTTPTGATYAITALGGSAIMPVISDTIWLNDKTVWLNFATSIYADAGINNGSGTALDADRHVLVGSTFPVDTSFGTNFAQASTYRATLTRHASDADLNRTAPTMTMTMAADYDSIGLTFSEAVCGSPEQDVLR